ncbi:toll/interleukin-1 receptor domain-containing protein [Vibrio fluvialis]|uniref:toll/interleukin-1 receptor domain-containing protein n=1 Tax=Vibrio fluvialis TaxID=676 RepID=UPI001F44643C|nr:toll/interleukin-1 receptor domain-containing protein [Vibrio fluvialis]MCE7609331.1 toll/interleukin-1 receptor domain-containing protein [Vibrio fluvialis]MCE7620885.1 toll/interleukin-1 receptor domain-containing protein [Vibrio fluvialis]MCE7626480.1 toll/interleukin-1 receptor domain-containing protein [Vibrio fluvialis]
MATPKVFLSYSHDSADHKQWVLDLATRLVNGGIDARIDAWSLAPGDDLPHFMETQLAEVDRVIMVCTDTYVQKANAGTGGVGYEKMIVTSSLMSRIDDNKIIPIIRQKGSTNVPTFLKSKLYIDFSNDNAFEAVIDDLMRAIHDAPLYKKPELGSNPYQTAKEKPAKPLADKKTELLKIIVEIYDNGFNIIPFSTILGSFGGSKIFAEVYMNQLIEEGLIKAVNKTVNSNGQWEPTYTLTNKAKLFAIQQGMVKE